MNRRGFFGRLAGVIAAAFIVKPAPLAQFKTRLWVQAPREPQRIWFSSPTDETIRRAYRDMLGRPATDAEIRQWLSD